MTYHQATYDEKYLNEMDSGNSFACEDLKEPEINESLRQENLHLPDISENDVVRHYVRLSQMNYAVDTGFYPLGSCTMKFNPKFADRIATDSRFIRVHPLMDYQYSQGNLQVMYELKEYLRIMSGMDAVSLQPLAGAHAEFTSMLIVRKYMEEVGGEERNEIIIPDSAHGTNPASAAMAGFSVVEIPSMENGVIDVDALKEALSEKTAAFMITNPNTLGIFESNIEEIADLVHKNGSLLYYDGANLNAILGITSPGAMGFDMVHFNLHKTFATPHGGGGPGAGPVAVRSFLEKYLPFPRIEKEEGKYVLKYDLEHSIGRVAGFQGSFVNLLRAWAYIKYKGSDGLLKNTQKAVLNANYLAKRLEPILNYRHEGLKKHEVIMSSKMVNKRALDIAKFIIDRGVHAPTIYFPLIVPEALMIEPTEDASLSDMDQFCQLIQEAVLTPDEELHALPLHLSIERADEVRAAKELKLKWDTK
ncbi:MAG: aminomethyl-transferring glycine dehydrogenase subunit GcvPB [Cuniculiplasma sp.]